jgi:anti-sigma factor RsiW
MHQPITERLEDYLSGMVDSEGREEIDRHLDSCEDCRRELNAMQKQSSLLKALRPNEDVDLAPGFYARVLDRIESQRIPSIWEILLEPAFGRRLAYASLTVMLLLGTLIVTSGNQDVASPAYYSYSPESILATEPVSQYMGDDLQHDRQVIFVNLATYETD